MISETISKQIAEAMKARDEVRLSTLRLLSASLHNAKIDKRGDLTEEEELKVVRREAKKRKDAIEALRQVLRPRAQDRVAQGIGRENDIRGRIEREEKELEILKEFLPEELSEVALTRMVDEAIKETGASSMADIGKVIGAVMKKAGGQADGKKVSDLVREKLL